MKDIKIIIYEINGQTLSIGIGEKIQIKYTYNQIYKIRISRDCKQYIVLFNFLIWIK